MARHALVVEIEPGLFDIQAIEQHWRAAHRDQHMVEDRFAFTLAASAHAYTLLAGFGHGIDTQVQIDIAFDDCLRALWTRGQRPHFEHAPVDHRAGPVR